MRPSEIQIGQIFSSIEVLAKELSRKRHSMFLCRCHCGKEFITRGSALISGGTKSCGCETKYLKGGKITHGESIGKIVSVEYNTYRTIKGRCYTKTHAKYKNYGGRGIKMCERWLESFANFLEDMGRRPPECNSIERVRVNGDYEPSNCIWATEEIQAANKTTTVRIIVEGVEIHLAALARKCGVNQEVIRGRLKKGQSGDEIVKYFEKRKNVNTII